MFTKQEIEKIFGSLQGLKVMIIGDVMVDAYLWGKVERISPEAPVPVVSLTRRENRLGGAANVALNIQSLGAVPVLCSVIGCDLKADEFEGLMNDKSLTFAGIIRSRKRPTTVKFRVIGNSSQLLRVDEEADHPLDEEESGELFSMISALLNDHVDVIIFEDYDKGVITPTLISRVAELAKQKGIPVAVDPKKRNFTNYSDITLFKPNMKELREGLKLGDISVSREEFECIVAGMMNDKNFEMVIVTLSEAGIFVACRKENQAIRSEIIPAHRRAIADVSGAGDTVISVAALGLALKLEPAKIAALANLAGGLVCEEVGVVPVDRQKLLAEALQKLM